MKRLKKYFFLKKLGIKHPWKASGDKNFIQIGTIHSFFEEDEEE